MKSKLSYLTASAAALVLTTASLQAANEPDSLYVKVDAGASFQQDLTLRVGPSSADASLNTGVRTAIGVGYNVSKSFAVEFETGSIWNSFDRIGGPIPSNMDIDLYQFPLLAKGILKLPLENGLTPYIGAGAGGILGRMNFHVDGYDDEDETSFVFAYQAEAGLKYAINEHIEVGVGYKFIGTSDYDFSFIETDNSYNHSFLASFVWNF